MKRRQILRASGAVALSAALPACEPTPMPTPSDRFAWGVASGDPTTRSVILWTRVAVREAEELEVEVFADVTLRERVVHELALAEPERDGCVKVDVEGLTPGQTYYYRFRFGEEVSALGRTRTLPEGSTEQLRLAVLTCSNYASGYFHAYRRVAERADLFAIVHLGDTIYEYADGEYGALRPLDPPHTAVTLADYRRRHACSRRDADAQEALRQHPFLVIWDDHEFANNAHREGAQAHDPLFDGDWGARVQAARRAFFEWMPVRDEVHLERALVFGDLARLVLLDTRMDDRDPPPIDADDWFRTDRRIVSDRQEQWVAQALARDDLHFTVLANQVVFAPFPVQNNVDAWDGYPAQRDRLLAAIARAPSPVIVLTGDTHASLAFDLPGPGYDARTQAGAVGVEWGTSAVSSPTLASDPREAERVYLAHTPHLRFTEQEHGGWVLLDLTPSRARAEFWLLDDVTRTDGGAEVLARAFEMRSGDRACRDADPAPSALFAEAPPLAP